MTTSDNENFTNEVLKFDNELITDSPIDQNKRYRLGISLFLLAPIFIFIFFLFFFCKEEFIALDDTWPISKSLKTLFRVQCSHPSHCNFPRFLIKIKLGARRI